MVVICVEGNTVVSVPVVEDSLLHATRCGTCLMKWTLSGVGFLHGVEVEHQEIHCPPRFAIFFHITMWWQHVNMYVCLSLVHFSSLGSVDDMVGRHIFLTSAVAYITGWLLACLCVPFEWTIWSTVASSSFITSVLNVLVFQVRASMFWHCVFSSWKPFLVVCFVVVRRKTKIGGQGTSSLFVIVWFSMKGVSCSGFFVVISICHRSELFCENMLITHVQ